MINDTVIFDFDTYVVKSDITLKAAWTRNDAFLNTLFEGAFNPDSDKVTQKRLNIGQAIDNCTGCHGYNGKGKGSDLSTVANAIYINKFPVLDGTTKEHNSKELTQEGIDYLKKVLPYGGSKVGDKLAGEIIYKRKYYRAGSSTRAGAIVSCEGCHGADGKLVSGRDFSLIEKGKVFDRAWYGSDGAGHKGSRLDSYQAYAVMEYIKTTLK